MLGRLSPAVRSFEVKRVFQGRVERLVDSIAVEEPLDISLGYWFKDTQRVQNLALTMRTPGADRELAAGLLLAEGVITGPADLVEVRSIGPEPSNEIVAQLAAHVDIDGWRLSRHTIANSSCGVCGKRSRDSIAIPALHTGSEPITVTQEVLKELPHLLAGQQIGFHQTGGLHAAALFSETGQFLHVYEDIGRHNALDKLIGHSLLTGELPWANRIVFLSSRSSFELVQKTAMAGGQMLVTVGGPSSLAIETARGLGMTLIGFLREGRCNIYSGDWRIDLKE